MRSAEQILDKRIYKVFVFKQIEKGFYDPTSLKEISDYTSENTDDGINVNINIGSKYKNYGSMLN